MLDTIFQNWYGIIGEDVFLLFFTSFFIFCFFFIFIDFWKQ